jgi:hypothetical protein
VIVLAVNLLGDGLRDRLDPRLRAAHVTMQGEPMLEVPTCIRSSSRSTA